MKSLPVQGWNQLSWWNPLRGWNQIRPFFRRKADLITKWFHPSKMDLFRTKDGFNWKNHFCLIDKSGFFMVPVTGLEPVRSQWPRDFKSLVSAYSTTPANCLVTRTRIELVLPPWKGGVLTAWPPGLTPNPIGSGLVAEVGLEPTTLRVWTECSSQLSYSATHI